LVNNQQSHGDVTGDLGYGTPDEYQDDYQRQADGVEKRRVF
jgi:hypothetical protein